MFNICWQSIGYRFWVWRSSSTAGIEAPSPAGSLAAEPSGFIEFLERLPRNPHPSVLPAVQAHPITFSIHASLCLVLICVHLRFLSPFNDMPSSFANRRASSKSGPGTEISVFIFLSTCRRESRPRNPPRHQYPRPDPFPSRSNRSRSLHQDIHVEFRLTGNRGH